MTLDPNLTNDENLRAWEANAQVWDAKMGEQGNDFFSILVWPVVRNFLQMDTWAVDGAPHILDVACGNGLTSRKLAEAGAEVTAIDFSSNLVSLAQERPNPGKRIRYQVMDASDEAQLLTLGTGIYNCALCNMGLFDMVDIEPLFRTLPKLIKPGGCFVFSITHPAFNNASCLRSVEEEFKDGALTSTYYVKSSRYLTPFRAYGVALRNQPKAQVYFDRPLQYYLNLGFENGFVLDGFAERGFPPETPATTPLAWGGKFSEIPAALVARMRLA